MTGIKTRTTAVENFIALSLEEEKADHLLTTSKCFFDRFIIAKMIVVE